MMMPFKELIDKHNINITGVLHCGASYGQERFEYDKYVSGKVIWVEAIPIVYEELLKNIEPFPKQSAICACVSNIDGQDVIFNVSNNESQSSSILQLGVHKDIHPEVHYVDQLNLTTKRLDSLFTKKDLQGLNFLNVDLQGAEAMAIDGMGDLIFQFEYVLAEVNKKETYQGCMVIEDFDMFMLQRGFERIETGQWVGDTWTDALYRRTYFNLI